MHPPELNILIAAITNQLYCALSERDFVNLGLFLSLLSKDIISMAALKDLCRVEAAEEEKAAKDGHFPHPPIAPIR